MCIYPGGLANRRMEGMDLHDPPNAMDPPHQELSEMKHAYVPQFWNDLSSDQHDDRAGIR